jgi:putative MFS transporter
MFADRIERKWQTVGVAVLVVIAVLTSVEVRDRTAIVLRGPLVAIGAPVISLNLHAYQFGLFPTCVRGVALGFAYCTGRVFGVPSSFIIAFAIAHFSLGEEIFVIAGAIAIVALSIGLLEPNT